MQACAGLVCLGSLLNFLPYLSAGVSSLLHSPCTFYSPHAGVVKAVVIFLEFSVKYGPEDAEDLKKILSAT